MDDEPEACLKLPGQVNEVAGRHEPASVDTEGTANDTGAKKQTSNGAFKDSMHPKPHDQCYYVVHPRADNLSFQLVQPENEHQC